MFENWNGIYREWWFYSDTAQSTEAAHQTSAINCGLSYFLPFLSWCHILIRFDLCRCVNILNMYIWMVYIVHRNFLVKLKTLYLEFFCVFCRICTSFFFSSLLSFDSIWFPCCMLNVFCVCRLSSFQRFSVICFFFTCSVEWGWSRLAYLVPMFAHMRGLCDMLCENFVDTFSSKTKKNWRWKKVLYT